MVLFYLVILCLKIIKYSAMRLTQDLRQLLLAFLDDQAKVASWGISNIQIEEDRLCFDVNGFIFHGPVEIKIQNDHFYHVKIGDNDLGQLLIEDLINTMDASIEHTQNYLIDLEKWLLK